jgi:zinc protease
MRRLSSLPVLAVSVVLAAPLSGQAPPPAPVSATAAPAAAPASVVPVWGYTDFGPAGVVASRTRVDDLDFTEVAFANGVRLNVKRTTFSPNSIRVAARLGTGQLTEPAANEPGLSTFASLAFSTGGLGKLGIADLEKVLMGKAAGIHFTSTMDAFIYEGQTNPRNLLFELQLLTASIEDPGYRPEAQRVARGRIDAAYQSFARSERGPLALQVPRLLAGGDPRFGLPARGEMMARTLDELKAWLSPQLASGPLEVSVVGDVDIDVVIDAAARTLGTLPKREPRAPLDDLRKVSFPRQPFIKDYAVETNAPKGLVAVYWPTSDGMDIQRSRRLNTLGLMLAERLRLRVSDRLPNGVSPTVASTASDIFPGYGYIVAIAIVEPPRAREIQNAIVAVAADLGANGVKQEELDGAMAKTLKSALETEQTNAYWMTVLGRAQERPEVLDWARNRLADFKAITKADIDALAKDYLGEDKASRVIIHPYPAPVSSPLLVSPTPPPDGL